MPTFRLLHSSHATCAAMVLKALAGWQGRAAPTGWQGGTAPTGGQGRTAPTNHSPLTIPSAVLIGGLEAAMYHCDCSQNRHFWDIGKGMVQWGNLNGQALTVVEKCLRSADAVERFTFAEYRGEIEAGRAVLVTLSFGAGSEEGLLAAVAAQQRVSVVGVGYAGEGSFGWLVVQLPDGLLDNPPLREREAVEKLKLLLSEEAGGDPRRQRLSWEGLNASVGNVVFTLVQ